MQTVFNWILRLALLAAGLVFAASLAIAVLFLLAWRGVQVIWARLTGRPVPPPVFSINPRAGFNRFYAGAQPRPADASPAAERRGSGKIADVTDVEARPVPPRDPSS